MATIKEVAVDCRTLAVTFPASTAVAVGDLLYNNSGVAARASAQADQGSETLNQRLFASLFLGVSADARLATETATGSRVVVADGVFDCTCPSTTWAVGELVGPSENSGGDGLENQQVEKVTDPSLAIGYCVKAGTSVTTVRVRLMSRYAPGAVRTPAAFDGNALFTGTITAGSDATDRVAVKGIYMTPANVAVAVPTIADAESSEVAVNVASAFSVQPAVGDAVIAIPQEALPTDCLYNGARVTATDQITLSFGTKEGGGGVTGANKNFKFLVFDLT